MFFKKRVTPVILTYYANGQVSFKNFAIYGCLWILLCATILYKILLFILPLINEHLYIHFGNVMYVLPVVVYFYFDRKIKYPTKWILLHSVLFLLWLCFFTQSLNKFYVWDLTGGNIGILLFHFIEQHIITDNQVQFETASLWQALLILIGSGLYLFIYGNSIK